MDGTYGREPRQGRIQLYWPIMGRSEFAGGDFGFSDTGPGDLPDALSSPQRQDACALGRSPRKGLAMPWAAGRPGAFPYTCARRPSRRAAGPGTGAQHTGCSAAWLARLLWEQEAAGSNPAIPTGHSVMDLGQPSRGSQSGSTATTPSTSTTGSVRPA